MDIKLGAKIIALRKAKEMTQEQLASLLGVSAPAVSKWETDSSYPDITMLCPLARALGTDVDTLLSYEETLAEEKLGQYMAEIIETANAGKTDEAERQLERLLHSYPSAVSLKFSAVTVFSMLEMISASCQENGELTKKKERWKARKKELTEAIFESGDPAYHLPAISLLVSLELAENHLDRAEELLQKTVSNTADFSMLWVQLYQKKGEPNKALDIVQRNLYKLISDMRTCLITLLGNNMDFDSERTLEICDIFCRQEELFGVGGGMGAAVAAEVYLRLGMKQEALDYLEKLVDWLPKSSALPNQALFYPTYSPHSIPFSSGKEINQTILMGLEQDDCFVELRGEERFQEIIRKLKKENKPLDIP